MHSYAHSSNHDHTQYLCGGSSWKEEGFSIIGREVRRGNAGKNDPDLLYTFTKLLDNENPSQSF